LTDVHAIFVIGHSPAILTETLAALAAAGVTVREVRIISTRTGADLLRRRLFAEGGWNAFVQTWSAFAGTIFPERNVQALATDDIRNASDNRMMAEAIFAAVRAWTDQDAPPLYASIAGGRKTMSYYMGFAMSLFARPGDRLMHVLVPEAWERDRGFLVPPPDQAGRIDLVDVPFIRLRNHLGPALRHADIDALIQSAQVAVDAALMHPLEVCVRARRIRFLGKEVALPEREFTYYQFFAQQKTRHCRQPQRPTCGQCRDCFLSFDAIDARKEELLIIRQQFGGICSAGYEAFEKAWKHARSAAINVPEPVRRINEAIERVFGADPRAEQIKVRNVGPRRRAAYGVMADKAQLRIVR